MTTTALAPIDEFKNTLSKMAGEFKSALPSHISAEKFARNLMTYIKLHPKLLECNRTSLYAAAMQAAQDGLIIDGREAALVPFKETAKFMPMVAGLTKKARNSGEIATIDAQEVYEKDLFEYWVDEKGPHFKHRPELGERGKPLLTYAYAITKDGAFYFEMVSDEQMLAIEKCSRSDGSPWKGPFRGEMKRKSALHRLLKYRVPASSDLEDFLRRDAEAMVATEPTPEPPPAATTRPKRTAEIVEAQTEQEPAQGQDAQEGDII